MIRRVCFIVGMCLLGSSALAQDPSGGLTGKTGLVDSLFVIASSGEVKYRDLVQPAIDSIAALGPEVVPHLIEKFATHSARDKWAVVFIIRKIGAPAVPFLIAGLEHTDPKVVERVCFSLGDVGDSTAIAPLVAVSRFPRWQVRAEAIASLGDIAGASALDAVEVAARDSVAMVRTSAAYALGRLRQNSSIELLLDLLGDRYYGARLNARDALVQLDTSAVTAAIGADWMLLPESSQEAVCRILAELGTDSALTLLLEIHRSGNAAVRIYAAEAILEADSLDATGFADSILVIPADPAARLQVESARRK